MSDTICLTYFQLGLVMLLGAMIFAFLAAVALGLVYGQRKRSEGYKLSIRWEANGKTAAQKRATAKANADDCGDKLSKSTLYVRVLAIAVFVLVVYLAVTRLGLVG